MADVRVVKVKLINYFVEEASRTEPDKQILVNRTAVRGDQVDVDDLSDAELTKLEDLGAFFSDEEFEALTSSATVEGGVEASPTTEINNEMTADEVAVVITDNNLNSDQTIALAQGDPELAELVGEAEDIASGGDPRKTVVAGLDRIIGA
jgi:hypothetical protein